jgi:UDP-perosamine 4-acetyltransferase
MTKLVLIGGGGHCKVVVDHLKLLNMDILGILDDDPAALGREILGVKVIGRVDELPTYRGRVDFTVIAITDPMTRKILDDKCKGASIETIGFIHPKAVISPWANISGKAQVCAGSIINPEAELHDHAIINTGAVVEHDCVVGQYCHIAPGVRLMGKVRIGPLSMIGASATVLQNLTVGGRSVVGAGALVLNNVEEGTKYLGLPARKVGGQIEHE